MKKLIKEVLLLFVLFTISCLYERLVTSFYLQKLQFICRFIAVPSLYVVMVFYMCKIKKNKVHCHAIADKLLAK